MQKPVLYEEKSENLLKDALKTNETESAFNGVQRMDVEIKRAIKFLQISTDLRQYQKRAEVNFVLNYDKKKHSNFSFRKNQLNQNLRLNVVHHRNLDRTIEFSVVTIPMVISILVEFKSLPIIIHCLHLIMATNNRSMIKY